MNRYRQVSQRNKISIEEYHNKINEWIKQQFEKTASSSTLSTHILNFDYECLLNDLEYLYKENDIPDTTLFDLQYLLNQIEFYKRKTRFSLNLGDFYRYCSFETAFNHLFDVFYPSFGEFITVGSNLIVDFKLMFYSFGSWNIDQTQAREIRTVPTKFLEDLKLNQSVKSWKFGKSKIDFSNIHEIDQLLQFKPSSSINVFECELSKDGGGGGDSGGERLITGFYENNVEFVKDIRILTMFENPSNYSRFKSMFYQCSNLTTVTLKFDGFQARSLGQLNSFMYFYVNLSLETSYLPNYDHFSENKHEEIADEVLKSIQNDPIYQTIPDFLTQLLEINTKIEKLVIIALYETTTNLHKINRYNSSNLIDNLILQIILPNDNNNNNNNVDEPCEIPKQLKSLDLWYNSQLYQDDRDSKQLIGMILKRGSIPSTVQVLSAPYFVLYQQQQQQCSDDMQSLIPDSVTELTVHGCNIENGIMGFLIPRSVRILKLYLEPESGPVEKQFIPSTVDQLLISRVKSGGDSKVVLKDLPLFNTITRLVIGFFINETIKKGMIPQSVEYLALSQPIDPDALINNRNIKTLILKHKDQITSNGGVLVFPDSITRLVLGTKTNSQPNLFIYPPNLSAFECYWSNIKVGMIPRTIKELVFHEMVLEIEPQSLPRSITQLEFMNNVTPRLCIGQSSQITRLKVYQGFHTVHQLPQSIRYLDIITKNEYHLQFLPSSLETLIIYASNIVFPTQWEELVKLLTQGLDTSKSDIPITFKRDSERYLMYALIHLADRGKSKEYTDSLFKLFETMLQVDNSTYIRRRSLAIQGFKILIDYKFIKKDTPLPLELLSNTLVPLFDGITKEYQNASRDLIYILNAFPNEDSYTFSKFLESIVKNILKVMDFTHTRAEQLEYQHNLLDYLGWLGKRYPNYYNKNPVLLEHIMSGMLQCFALEQFDIETWNASKEDFDQTGTIHSEKLNLLLDSLIQSHGKLLWGAIENVRSSFMKSQNWKYRFAVVFMYSMMFVLFKNPEVILNQFPKIFDTVLLKLLEDPQPKVRWGFYRLALYLYQKTQPKYQSIFIEKAFNTITNDSNPRVISLALHMIYKLLLNCSSISSPYFEKILSALPALIKGDTYKSSLIITHVLTILKYLKNSLHFRLTYYDLYVPSLINCIQFYSKNFQIRTKIFEILGDYINENHQKSQNIKKETSKLMSISLNLDHKFDNLLYYLIHIRVYYLSVDTLRGSNLVPYGKLLGQVFGDFFQNQTNSELSIEMLTGKKGIMILLNQFLEQSLNFPLQNLVGILQSLFKFYKSFENCTLEQANELKLRCLELPRLLLLKHINTNRRDEKSFEIMYKEIFEFIVPRLAKYQTLEPFSLFSELFFQITNSTNILRVTESKIEMFPDVPLICKQLKTIIASRKEQKFGFKEVNSLVYILKSLCQRLSSSEAFLDMFQSILSCCSQDEPTVLPWLAPILSDYILSGSPKLLEHFPIIIPTLIRVLTDKTLEAPVKGRAVLGLMYAAYISREKFEPFAVKSLAATSRILTDYIPDDDQDSMRDRAVCAMIWIFTALPSSFSSNLPIYYGLWTHLLPLQTKLHYYPIMFEAIVTLFERHGFQKMFPTPTTSPIIKSLNEIGFGLRNRLIDKDIRVRLKKILANDDNLNYYSKAANLPQVGNKEIAIPLYNVDVAIIGMGVRLPGNGNCRPSQLWESLLNGFDGIIDTTERWSDSYSKMSEVSSNKAGLLELEDWMTFDPLFFGINPTDAKQVDPQQKMLLKTTWE
eukprot:gene4872-6077_t